MGPRDEPVARLLTLYNNLQPKVLKPIMLIMKMTARVAEIKFKKIFILTVVIIVIVAISTIFVWHSRKIPNKTMGFSGNTISNSEIIERDNAGAEKAISNKDFQSAASYYVEASNVAQANGNTSQAEDYLIEATKKIPDKNVPWIIWNDLVGLSQARGEKNMEVSSLKKAIYTAQQPNSGAPQGIVAAYQRMLTKLE